MKNLEQFLENLHTCEKRPLETPTKYFSADIAFGCLSCLGKHLHYKDIVIFRVPSYNECGWSHQLKASMSINYGNIIIEAFLSCQGEAMYLD